MYLVSAPSWIKWIYPSLVWDIPTQEKELFLTFDDGPHPIATPFVLDLLKQFNAKATFFCLGCNVEQYRDIYTRILDEGHSVGNHTYSHLNGWKAKDEDYLGDIKKASEVIDSGIFRPPYGRISRFQASAISRQFRIIMWNVLSGDWDKKIDGTKCYKNVVSNAKPGAIIVFHDSEKALDRLQFALPRLLEYYNAQDYIFNKIV